MLSPSEIAQLADELRLDPAGVGYRAADTSMRADGELVELLNAPRPGVELSGARGVVPIRDVLAAIAVSDVSSLAATQRDVLRVFLAAPDLDTANAAALGNLTTLFAAGSGSRSRLSALGSRTGSRFEALFGHNRSATMLDVARALGRG